MFTRELLNLDGWIISIDLGTFTLIDVYVPLGSGMEAERNDFLRKTLPSYACTTTLSLISLGDFNGVDHVADRTTSNVPVVLNRITVVLHQPAWCSDYMHNVIQCMNV